MSCVKLICLYLWCSCNVTYYVSALLTLCKYRMSSILFLSHSCRDKYDFIIMLYYMLILLLATSKWTVIDGYTLGYINKVCQMSTVELNHGCSIQIDGFVCANYDTPAFYSCEKFVLLLLLLLLLLCLCII